MPDGSCEGLTQQACVDAGGAYEGDDTLCEETACPIQGACCVNVGVYLCFEETDAECAARPQSSKFFTPLGTCANGCGNGACCALDGTCSAVSGTECTLVPESEFNLGGTCSPNTCEVRGACCTTNGCAIATEAECTDTNGLNGTYRGDGASCSDANICDKAACCNGTSCTDEFIADCASGIHGNPGELCQPNTCASGACCVDFGTGSLSCQPGLQLFTCRDLANQPGISFSQFAGAGVTCASSPCSNLLGACCQYDGSCTDLNQSQCSAIAGSTFQLGVSCAAASCPDVCGIGIDGDFDSNGHVDLRDFAEFQRCMGASTVQCLCPFDANTNGVIDVGDVPTFVPALTGPQASAPPCSPFSTYAPGDYNDDGQVDLADFAALQRCAPAPTLQCRCLFDVDGDANLRGEDFEALAMILTGP